MYTSLPTWSLSGMGRCTLFRKVYRLCTIFIMQMACIYILNLPIGIGRIVLTKPTLVCCKLKEIGYGTKHGAAMPGTANGTVHRKINIGLHNWLHNMVLRKLLVLIRP